MRRLAPLLLLTALILAACSLDLVDPTVRPSPPDFAILIDATGRASGQIRASAGLRPGGTLDSRERRVLTPWLAVAGQRIAPDSSYSTGLLELRWSGSIPVASLPSDTVAVSFPTVEGANAPSPLLVSLVPMPWEPPRVEWPQEDDLILQIPQSGDAGYVTRWVLSVYGYDPTGKRLLFWSHYQTEVPDSINVLPAWLPATRYDSIDVVVEYTSRYSATPADSTYLASVFVQNQLVWGFERGGP